MICFLRSTSDNGEIVGSWEFVGAYNKPQKLSCCPECPDVFKFENNSTYKVLNVCYGDDSRDPITETGAWTIDNSLNKIILYKRKFTSNYYSYSSAEKIELNIVSLTSDSLKLSLEKSSVECYKRRK